MADIAINPQGEIVQTGGDLIITLDGRDIALNKADYGLTMESTERQILDAVRGAVREEMATDRDAGGDDGFDDDGGEPVLTVRKATNSGKIYVYPKPVAGVARRAPVRRPRAATVVPSAVVAGGPTALPEQSDEARLKVYKMLTAACSHLYSKGVLQVDKFKEAAALFADLAKRDPFFMAHFAAWAAKQESKDQKVLSVFFNFLNDADGQPFFPGAEANKPNLRRVSQALLQKMDPHLVLRVAELAKVKFGVPGLLNDGMHFPRTLRTALGRYIDYREANPDMLLGMFKAGLAPKMRSIYYLAHRAPSDTACSFLQWGTQKDGRVIEEVHLPDFSKLSSQEIAEKLESEKISAVVAASIIPKGKMTVAVAKALLGNCTGNQAIILYRLFARNGFLEVKSIKELFAAKAATAGTAVDRIDILTADADEGDRVMMADIRSASRKKVARKAGIRSIYMHIDKSGSMSPAIQFAKNAAAVLAECVDEPEKNFGWGLFDTSGRQLKVPSKFTKEAFHQALYGQNSGGGTNCFALYEAARRFGAEVDVYVTDQGHNAGDFASLVRNFHERNPDLPKPKAVIIVWFRNTGDSSTRLEVGFKDNGVPVTVMAPEALTESALVAQSVQTALVGEFAVIDQIMETPLPDLPGWWDKVGASAAKPVEEKVKADAGA